VSRYFYGGRLTRLQNRCEHKGETTTLARNSIESFIPLRDNISFVWISYIQYTCLRALSLKFRHIYSIGWKYSLAHQKIAGTTFERTVYWLLRDRKF